MTLGQTLKLIMFKLGIKQIPLGARLQTSQGQISKMLNSGEWEQHWQMVLRILDLCETLGIDPHATAPNLKGIKTMPAVIPYAVHDGERNLDVPAVTTAKTAPAAETARHGALPKSRDRHRKKS